MSDPQNIPAAPSTPAEPSTVEMSSAPTFDAPAAPAPAAPAPAAPASADAGSHAAAPAQGAANGTKGLLMVCLGVLTLAVLTVLARLAVALIDLLGAETQVAQAFENSEALTSTGNALGIVGWVLGLATLALAALVNSRTGNLLRIGTGVITVSLVLMFIATRLINNMANSSVENADSIQGLIGTIEKVGMAELAAAVILGLALIAGAVLNLLRVRSLARQTA